MARVNVVGDANTEGDCASREWTNNDSAVWGSSVTLVSSLICLTEGL